MQPIVVVLDLGSADAARATFERLRQAIERMQGMPPIVLPHDLARVAVVAPSLASAAATARALAEQSMRRMYEDLAGLRFDKVFRDDHERHQPTDLAAMIRELKAFAAKRAPRYPKHDVPNALLRQRRGDMLRASTRPGAEWMAGHARKVVRRVHRHRRRT